MSRFLLFYIIMGVGCEELAQAHCQRRRYNDSANLTAGTEKAKPIYQSRLVHTSLELLQHLKAMHSDNITVLKTALRTLLEKY